MTPDDWRLLTRRDVLRLAAGAGLAAAGRGLVGCARPTQVPSWVDPKDDNPIAFLPDGPAPRRYFGDELERFHSVLWKKAEALSAHGGLAAATVESPRVRVCVVGGGLAGLSAAWLLRDLHPVVLEGASRFGGNAKAHAWGDLVYVTGSAYINPEDPTTEKMQMLRALGVLEHGRIDDPTEDQMMVEGTLYSRFWYGGTNPARAADFRAAWDYFKHVRDHAYPTIPYEADGDLSPTEFKALDDRSFADVLRSGLGARLHPHVEEVARQYCWSSFGADHTEISGALGLNYLAGDLGGMLVFPGGNAAISQGLVTGLRSALGAGALRSQAMTVDVRRTDDGVRVTYLDAGGQLRTISCDTCIVCTPKFVAARLIDDLPAAQLSAIRQILYRSYLVAHVLIDQPHPPDFHDLFCILGKDPETCSHDQVARRPFTDVVMASFAQQGHPSRTVLSLYRGMCFDGGRAELFMPDSYETNRRLIEEALPPVLRAIDLDPRRVHDIRMSRWGHPMVVPRPGQLTGGVGQAASAPHKDRIFFAQQDNLLSAAFDASFSAASDAAKAVRQVVRG